MAQTVFYSWQSDLPHSYNRNFLENALKKAIKELNKELPVDFAEREETVELDKDTQNISGHPAITDTIFQKIDNCLLFVGDLSFVGVEGNKKLLSNPNVLIEYGYALKSRSSNNILLVMNTEYGEPGHLNAQCCPVVCCGYGN